ncbi:hypothetical protein CERZMDRAFT_88290 [Cercospora zeae-maydis SCOH1-5]|uniref:Uncharacterized protein n=1 Tax=Cercospora zeae-maydis SCOH1-5 TaxID=717836 RepID=A0A6A6F1L4_9PEZI|nr:hypothetical protein CERZMDRAFT_88290 [Cercospora zeae-maydis SCOH1-5]
MSGVFLTVTCCFHRGKKAREDNAAYEAVSMMDEDGESAIPPCPPSSPTSSPPGPTPLPPRPSFAPRPSCAPRPTSWFAGSKKADNLQPQLDSDIATATTTIDPDAEAVVEPQPVIRHRPSFPNLRQAAQQIGNITLPSRRLFRELSDTTEQASRMVLLGHADRYHRTPAIVLTEPDADLPPGTRELQHHMKHQDCLRDEHGALRTGLPVQRKLKGRTWWSDDGTRVMRYRSDYYSDESRKAIRKTPRPDTPRARPESMDEDDLSFLWLGGALVDDEAVWDRIAKEESRDVVFRLGVAPADILKMPAQLEEETVGSPRDDDEPEEFEWISRRMSLNSRTAKEQQAEQKADGMRGRLDMLR